MRTTVLLTDSACDLSPELEKDLRKLSGEEKQAQGIRSLPKNLDEALNKMEQDPWIGQTLGSLYTEHYAKRKREEWENYSRQVSEWELGQYLYRI